MFKDIETSKRLAKILGVHLLLTIGLIFIIDATLEVRDFETSLKRGFDESPIIYFLFGVIVAPLWEEMVYRYPLKRGVRLWWPLIFGTLFLLNFELLVLQILMVIFLLSICIFRIRQSRFITYFTIGISILVFGLIHMENFLVEDIEQMKFIELILTFISQIFGGIILTFIRLRYSFKYGVVYHGVYNAILFSIALIGESM